jgi:hypothetical protein
MEKKDDAYAALSWNKTPSISIDKAVKLSR